VTTKIGLISDVHSSPVPLKQALDIFDKERVSDIICAGDIAGYYETLEPTINLLIQKNCKTIIGNHDQTYLEAYPELHNTKESRFLRELPQTLELVIEDKRIYVVHAHPPSSQHGGIKLLDQDGDIIQQRKDLWCGELQDFDYDVLIVGHTHQVFAEQLGEVFVVNPGSSAFNHSCMILSLPDLKVQIFALENKEIIKCWNFGMLRG
jgi:putative phosphoesterase